MGSKRMNSRGGGGTFTFSSNGSNILPKKRNPFAVHAFNKGHTVEPNRKARRAAKSCRGKVSKDV